MFTFVERPPEDASMIESRWVMGRKLLTNGQTEKWKVRLVSRGDQQSLEITMISHLQSLIRPQFDLPSALQPSMTLRLSYLTSQLHFSAALGNRLSTCTSPMANGLTSIAELAQSSS